MNAPVFTERCEGCDSFACPGPQVCDPMPVVAVAAVDPWAEPVAS